MRQAVNLWTTSTWRNFCETSTPAGLLSTPARVQLLPL